jgi:hypothetical protein
VIYFGDISESSISKADVAKVLNESIQITSAFDMYTISNAGGSATISELKDAEYLLSSFPSGWGIQDGVATVSSIEGATIEDATCLAINQDLGIVDNPDDLVTGLYDCTAPPAGAVSFCCVAP